MRMDGALGTVTSSLRATKQESSERNGERKRDGGGRLRERQKLRAGCLKSMP